MGLQIVRYTHTHKPKWPHNWSSVTSHYLRSKANETQAHASVHLMGGYIPVFNKVQAPAEAFSILGALSTSLPWTLQCLMRVTLKPQPLPYYSIVHICVQSDCINHMPINYFLSPHPALVAIAWYHPLHITSLVSTTHILHVSSLPPCHISPKGWGCACSVGLKPVTALPALHFRWQFEKPRCLASGLPDRAIIHPTEDVQQHYLAESGSRVLLLNSKCVKVGAGVPQLMSRDICIVLSYVSSDSSCTRCQLWTQGRAKKNEAMTGRPEGEA